MDPRTAHPLNRPTEPENRAPHAKTAASRTPDQAPRPASRPIVPRIDSSVLDPSPSRLPIPHTDTTDAESRIHLAPRSPPPTMRYPPPMPRTRLTPPQVGLF
jgi:hypothetical protein